MEGGILKYGTDSEPTGFDPHTVSEEASLRIINQLYETLVATNADMTYYGQLAERWEIPDDVTYIFYLRKGVKFHSGREMTADELLACGSFDRVLGKTEAGDIGALGSKDSYYGGIESVEAVDDYTVKFTLKEPNAAFLGNLTSNYGAIVDKDVIAENGDLMRADGGTGPFMLGEWLPDNYVEGRSSRRTGRPTGSSWAASPTTSSATRLPVWPPCAPARSTSPTSPPLT